MEFELKFKRRALAAVISSMTAGGAHATTYDVYNNLVSATGDGSELADRLIMPGTGVHRINSSFQGFFGGVGSICGNASIVCEGDYGGEVSVSFLDSEEGEYGGDGEYGGEYGGDPGSASFFSNLNFGTLNGVDFTLPDGILLSSGNAQLPTTNTESGFTGLASGVGDQGLQDLLDSYDFDTGESEYGGEYGGGHDSTDATVLAFDFTVEEGIGAVSLQFMFGSDEFSEYVDSYPEIAGIFIDGVNYAVLPDGSPLTFTGQTVGAGNYFNNDPFNTELESAPLDVEYDGITRPLTLFGLLDPNRQTHSIKIAVSDTNDEILDTGLFVANLRGMPLIPGSDPDAPLLPVPGDDPSDGFNFIIDVGDTGVGIDPLFPIFIDPEVAVGYTYEVIGSTFASVTLPVLGFGDNLYDILGWNGSSFELLVADFDSTQDNPFLFGGGGYSMFQVLGIEVEGGLDPNDPTAFVTGVTFTAAGTGIQVTQTAITQNVPEPGTVALTLAGLFGLTLRRRVATR